MSRKTNKLKSRLEITERRLRSLEIVARATANALINVKGDLENLVKEKQSGWRQDGSIFLCIRPADNHYGWRGERYALSIEISADALMDEWRRKGVPAHSFEFDNYTDWLKCIGRDIGQKATAAMVEFFQVKMGLKQKQAAIRPGSH